MQLLTYSKALADETRLRLARVLLVHELSVGELVRALGLRQSRISRHLKILAAAGLVSARRDGQWVYYSAAENGGARAYLDAVAPFFDDGPGTFAADTDAAAREVRQRARRTEAFFDSHAEKWDDLRERTLGGLDLAALILSHLPEADTAADLGCGTGALLEHLRGRAARVIGVDSSSRMLDQAREFFAGNGAAADVSLRIGDLEHLPLRDAEADAAVMSLALHHLPSPAHGVAEAHRVLTPGGTFVLVDFEKHDDETMREQYGDNWLGFSPGRVEKWLSGAGFDLQESTRHPLPSGLALRVYAAVKQPLEESHG